MWIINNWTTFRPDTPRNRGDLEKYTQRPPSPGLCGIFRSAEYVFEDYFGVPRHVDAQKAISSPIIVSSANLSIPGGFSTRWVRFWGLFRCTSTRWCSGGDFVANHSLYRKFECTWEVFRSACFWGLLQENHILKKYSLSFAVSVDSHILRCSCGFVASKRLYWLHIELGERTIGFSLPFSAIWRERTRETTYTHPAIKVM